MRIPARRIPDSATYLIPEAEALQHRVEVDGRMFGVTRVIVRARPYGGGRIWLFGRPIRDGAIAGHADNYCAIPAEASSARAICRVLGIRVPATGTATQNMV